MFLRKTILCCALNNVRRLRAVEQTQWNRITPNKVVLWKAPFCTATATSLDFSNEKLQKFLESLRQEFYALRVNGGSSAEGHRRMGQLSEIVRLLEQHRTLLGNIVTKADIEAEKDEDMRELMEEENQVYTHLLSKTERDLLQQLPTLADNEYYPSLIFEVNAGAGGQEAMLFARELLDMYIHYFDNNGWDYEVLAEDVTDIGGLRHANLIVHAADAYNKLRYEAGVHRVQRVPATEKSGRIHTSTASVAVIPRPENVSVTIAEKDLKIETKRASGAGGQHVNTTDSAVRIVHLPTGIAVESQTERSQLKNREIALKRLQAKLLQQQLERVEASTKATRKAQQGNLDRNEKIRTYNFVQDRVTDHRIPAGTVHNLPEFLEGGEHLDNFIQRLVAENRKAKLLEMIENWRDSEPTADEGKIHHERKQRT